VSACSYDRLNQAEQTPIARPRKLSRKLNFFGLEEDKENQDTNNPLPLTKMPALS